MPSSWPSCAHFATDPSSRSALPHTKSLANRVQEDFYHWADVFDRFDDMSQGEQDNAIDYTGYSAGVAWAIGRHAELDVRWYGTDGPGSDPRYADSLVAEISFAF